MSSFAELVTSRKAWINDVLAPWCRAAARKDLLLAEQEWTDIAGKVDPESTLWRWAWSRFPELVHESLGIDESSEVAVALKSGRRIRGFPDGRKSQSGRLVLLTATTDHRGFDDAGPFSLDEIASVKRIGTIDPVDGAVP